MFYHRVNTVPLILIKIYNGWYININLYKCTINYINVLIICIKYIIKHIICVCMELLGRVLSSVYIIINLLSFHAFYFSPTSQNSIFSGATFKILRFDVPRIPLSPNPGLSLFPPTLTYMSSSLLY